MARRRKRPPRERQVLFPGLGIEPRPTRPAPTPILRTRPTPDGTAWEVAHRNGVILGEAVMDVDGEPKFWFEGGPPGGWGAHVLRAIADFLEDHTIPIEPPAHPTRADPTIPAPWE
jgi:hypothetical protein